MDHVLALIALFRPMRVWGTYARHTAAILVLILLGLTSAPVQAEPESQQPIDSEISCSETFHEQEIPDDGSWLQVCLLDSIRPDEGTVTEVNIRYVLDHPDPTQLEILLTRENSDVSQPLLEKGSSGEEIELGNVIGLETFNGTPAQGGWLLMVRDVIPGKKGWLRGLTVRPFYAPIGPMPKQLSGSPGKPTSFRFPPGIAEYTAPDVTGIEPEFEVPGTLLETSGWVTIKTELFEAFPSGGWTLSDGYPGDGNEYWWDEDNSRSYTGWNAAWPAKGGADGLNPPGDPYPPYAYSWMKYGPIDLSDAATAEVSFWLWLELQNDSDSIWFGISEDIDGTYNGWQWFGVQNWWEEYSYTMDGYYGDDSVYVAWLFISDSSPNLYAEGPWVDQAVVRKYLAGDVTPQGTLLYPDRSGFLQPAQSMNAYLYDEDTEGYDDQLFEDPITTNSDGTFDFPTLANYDEDDPADPDPRLDLYVIWETDDESTHNRVTYLGGYPYQWRSVPTHTNTSDGVVDFSGTISISDATRSALWIFQDLRNSWEYVRNYTSPQFDPGSVTAKWEFGVDCYPFKPFCSSFFDGGVGGPFIFISNPSRISVDTVIHETGHNYVYNATGWWLWDDPWCYDHNLFTQESTMCSWSEGWADFFPLAITAPTDQCYDKLVGPCTGTVDSDYYNLETHGRGDQFSWGDNIEGRVAGALYDIFDSTNANETTFDTADFSFDSITDIVFQETDYYALYDFWNDWKNSGLNKHDAVRAIFQNTIDYDTAPRFEPFLPDRNVFQDHSYSHLIDLWAYTTDDESADGELSYQIANLPDSRCGISLDSHWINISPQSGWLGSCDVVIRVSDTIWPVTDSFTVTVVPVVGTVYMPIIMNKIVFMEGMTKGGKNETFIGLCSSSYELDRLWRRLFVWQA